MNYSEEPNSVRVDIFKPSGKWYTTVALNWDRYRSGNPQDGADDYESIQNTFRRCMKEQFQDRWSGMTVVCLEPYHENAFPLMITLPDHQEAPCP